MRHPLIVVLGWMAGECQEHLVEAWLPQREVGKGDAGAGELRERVRNAFGI
jgi:hypothetical protein